MYIDGKVGGKSLSIMVDTGAMHYFIQSSEAKRLGVKTEKTKGWLKTRNVEVRPLDEVAKGVELQLSDWGESLRAPPSILTSLDKEVDHAHMEGIDEPAAPTCKNNTSTRDE
ncbi:hypothetical protein QQ045_031103 [Rhodiola kirilowii]